MKHQLLYLCSLLFVVILATGCIKSSVNTPPPQVPSGIFTGQFRYLHRHTNTVPYDTLSANITVNLTTPSFTFKVTGDTATVHAGSHGTFGLASPYLVFNDSTYSKTAPVTKSHLSGYYLYSYDGTNLQMLAYSLDTLALQYSLKKTGN